MFAKTLVSRFVDLLTDAPTGLPPQAGPAAAAPGEAVDQEGGDRRIFETRLRDALTQGGRVSGGRVQLLNLGELQQRYGDRWPLLTGKIDQIVAATLKRRLGPRDVFTRCGDGVYAIVFAGLDEVEAQLKCALIAEEILGKLLGDESGAQSVQIASTVTELNDRLEIQSFNRLDALTALLDSCVPQAVADPAATARDGGIPQAVASALNQAAQKLAGWERLPPPQRPAVAAELVRLLGPMHQAQEIVADLAANRNREALAATAAVGTPVSQPDALAESYRRLGRAIEQLIHRTEAQVEAHVEAAGLSPVAAPDETAPAVLAVRYQPMWHVATKVLGSYRCEVGVDVGGAFHGGDTVLPADPNPQLLARLDRLALHDALSRIAQVGPHQTPVITTVPVHHSTLIRPTLRQDYMALCQALPSADRKLLVWEIVDPMLGFTNAELPPSIAMLRQYGRAVLLATDLDQPRFEDLARIGLHAVGVDLRRIEADEPELMRRLNLFRARGERHGLRAYVRGLSSLSLAMSAVCAGFDYVEGPSIARDVDTPLGIVSFGLDELYGRSAASPLP